MILSIFSPVISEIGRAVGAASDKGVLQAGVIVGEGLVVVVDLRHVGLAKMFG